MKLFVLLNTYFSGNPEEPLTKNFLAGEFQCNGGKDGQAIELVTESASY
jgi:hypothetical protein